MNKIKCLILEDQPIASTLLESYVNSDERLELLGITDTIAEAKEQIYIHEPDLAFVDIDLPDGKGTDLVYQLQDTNTSVIMTTGHTYFAVESYSLQVLDYLLKPIELPRFKLAIEKAVKLLRRETGEPTLDAYPSGTASDYISVRVNGQHHPVQLSRIVFLEAAGENVRIHLENDTMMTHQPFYKMTETLPAEMFIRIHRSYTVNVNRISKFSSKMLTLGELELPVGRHYYPELKRLYSSREVEE